MADPNPTLAAPPPKPERTLEQRVVHAVMEGIHDAVKSKLTGYQSPLDEMIAEVIDGRRMEIQTLLTESVKSAIDDPEFRQEIKAATRSRLAGLLVQRFGGELEKQVNQLKQDPTTRAKVTTFLDEIVSSGLAKTS